METVRTCLRRIRQSDFENIRMLESDPAIMQFTPSRIPQSEEQTLVRIKNQIEKQKAFEPFGIWVAEERDTSAFVGWFMLIPGKEKELELGFMLSKEKWGLGFATEIAGALIDFARDSGISRIIATTNLENVVSIRVLAKLGFRYTKNVSVPEKVHGGEIELKVYELLIG